MHVPNSVAPTAVRWRRPTTIDVARPGRTEQGGRRIGRDDGVVDVDLPTPAGAGDGSLDDVSRIAAARRIGVHHEEPDVAPGGLVGRPSDGGVVGPVVVAVDADDEPFDRRARRGQRHHRHRTLAVAADEARRGPGAEAALRVVATRADHDEVGPPATVAQGPTRVARPTCPR